VEPGLLQLARHERRRAAQGDLPAVRQLGPEPHQAASDPPSTGTYAPVMNEEASLSRKAMTDAISSGDAGRPMGVRSIIRSRFTGSARLFADIGVSTTPGPTMLTRMP